MIEPSDHGRLLHSFLIWLSYEPAATSRARATANSVLCSTPAPHGSHASNLEHMHVTCGLLVPNATHRGAHRTPYRLGDGFRVACTAPGHRTECLNCRAIRDVLDPMSQPVGFGNTSEHHARVAHQLAALAHGERNRHHSGKTQPAAVGDGALICADHQGAIAVEPSRRHLVDLSRITRRQP